MSVSAQRERVAIATSQIRLLYELRHRARRRPDPIDVSRFAARRAREIFDADGCGLLVLDADRAHLHFAVASQSTAREDSASRLAAVRVPVEHSIAGWAVRHDRPALVDHAVDDPRFYAHVDRQTNMETRAVLCAPLRTGQGPVGAIEIVNPASGSLGPSDVRFVEALAAEIGGVYERKRLDDLLGRQLRRFAGLVLLVLGIVCGAGAVLAHLAWALPLGELAARPALQAAAVATATGTALLGLGWRKDRDGR